MTSTEAVLPEKCPCCDNPWSRATGDLFAKLCADCESAKEKPTFGLDRSNMDETVSASENFFQHANGGWIRANPIPAGYPSWNTFLSLHVQSQERCKALLEGLTTSDEKEPEEESKDDAKREEQQKVSDFYRAAMDEAAIETVGLAPVQGTVLALVEEIVAAQKSGEKKEYAQLLGKLAADYGIYPFFSTSASPDYKNSDHSLCQISQGGLGLPDRDYYFDEDKQEIREAYVEHVAKMLTLLDGGESVTDETRQRAQEIFDLEVQLAKAHMTRTENRDPQATYNKMSIADLVARGKDAFSFDAYLLGSTGKSVEELGDVNVRNTAALERVAEVTSSVSPTVLQSYLQWHVVTSLAPYLSAAFVSENFEFYEKKLSGTQEIKPRWKRAMAFTESALGEALGQLYCAEYFDHECKVRAEAIVESVRSALESRLQEVDWIKADSTREEALKKMSRFRVKIGYPNKWIDYGTLKISADDDFMTMVFKARAFDHQRTVKEMNAPTDREKWFMTPQTVNAYYHPSLNEIVFPAAILQHPFFDPQADDAVNYGAMGAVVGHEMTHGFDDKGRKFNFEGILQDWWSEEDATEYEGRVEVMVEQANNFQVLGKSVQGKLTSGENIADLGGLRLALRALKARDDYDDSLKIDGFTPTQRFFLAWAQCWRQNITDERSLQLLTLDPHGPNEMRCNGPLSNMAEFHTAFDVPSTEETPMYRPTEARVDIW